MARSRSIALVTVGALFAIFHCNAVPVSRTLQPTGGASRASAAVAYAATLPSPGHLVHTRAWGPQQHRALVDGGANASSSGLPWRQEANLLAADERASDSFGWSVATDGDTAVIGAPYHGGNLTGAAYVFVRDGDDWRQQAELTASDAAPGDHFGYAVALAGDTVLVGAMGKEAAYVFMRSGGRWRQQAKLSAPTGQSPSQFGFAVALCDDTAIIAAPSSDAGTGASYVFLRQANTWTQQTVLVAADGTLHDAFGYSVAIDNDIIAVGAEGKNNDAGAVYVFGRMGPGWSQQAELTAMDGTSGSLGWSVDVAGDTVVAGALYTNDHRGAAYVFARIGTTWGQQAELTAPDGAPQDTFGIAVALSGAVWNAPTIIVGASGKNRGRGAAYVFRRYGTNWHLQAELTSADATPNGAFGYAVAVTGCTGLIGAPAKYRAAGSAYVFVPMSTSTVSFSEHCPVGAP